MEMEEKIEKLVSKCFEKDKFIQRVGSVLRGCRCGIVSASLLDELAQAESQLEKPDYQQLISPHTNATSHVRLQGDTISSAWSSLGTISSQLLNKEEQSNQQASTSLSTSQQLQDTQYVQVAESRAYPVSESAIAASYVEEDLSAPRYVSEVVVSMPQSEQYESRMVISQIDHQYHGSVQDRGDGSTETEQRSLLNNFTELTYENFVENVSYPPESPESNSEIYTLNNPVITHLLEKPRLDADSEQEERVETNELESKIESQDTERKEEGNELNYRCKFCEVGFEKASDLFQHQRSHEDDDQDKQGKKDKKGKKNKKSMCNICDKPFAYESNLKYHMRIHTGEKPFKCHECGKCFTQSGQLTSHSLVHLKKFKCSLCTRYFTEEIILVQHMKIHRKDYPVTCGKCGEVCYDKEQLKRHKKEHPKEKVLECHICPRRFAYQSKLKEHKVKRHGYDDGKPKQEVQKNEKQVMCGKCGKKFATRYTFRRHTNRCFVQDNSIVQQDVEVHTTFEKSFLDSGGLPSEGLNLEDCMITLDVQSSFSEKPKSSTEGKSKECELCNKVLCNAYSLKKHMLTHTGEKPYMCDLCGKCFTSSYVLKEHCLSHAGIKNFKCEQCDKSFLNVRKLQIHFQTHNRPKTFTCKICSRTLSAGTFDRHMNIHMRTGHIVFPPSNTSMS